MWWLRWRRCRGPHRERALAAGLRLAELPPVADIDEPADAAWVARVKRLLLVGAGHAHVQCSSLGPGWLAGAYRYESFMAQLLRPPHSVRPARIAHEAAHLRFAPLARDVAVATERMAAKAVTHRGNRSRRGAAVIAR